MKINTTEGFTIAMNSTQISAKDFDDMTWREDFADVVGKLLLRSDLPRGRVLDSLAAHKHECGDPAPPNCKCGLHKRPYYTIDGYITVSPGLGACSHEESFAAWFNSHATCGHSPFSKDDAAYASAALHAVAVLVSDSRYGKLRPSDAGPPIIESFVSSPSRLYSHIILTMQHSAILCSSIYLLPVQRLVPQRCSALRERKQ